MDREYGNHLEANDIKYKRGLIEKENGIN